MIDSPLLRRLLAKQGQECLLIAARARFGVVPSWVAKKVRGIVNETHCANF